MTKQEINDVLLLYSHILSTITIIFCFFLKLPQIFKIKNQKSVTGLNLPGLLLELGSYTVTASYNFINGYSLMSYLEYPIIIVQELTLIYLYLLYSHNLNLKSFSMLGLYGAIVCCLCSEVIPSKILDLSVIFCTPVSLSSKILQLWEIWRIKSANSVSVFTWFLSTFTNSARLYTVMMDSADVVLLTNFGLSSLLGLSIMLSAQHFQNKSLDTSKTF